jgi:hypothetical protein
MGLACAKQGLLRATVIEAVTPFISNSKVYGFYLMDEPDPTGKYKLVCPASNLKSEAAWMRANLSGAETFIVLMNLGTSLNGIYEHLQPRQHRNRIIRPGRIPVQEGIERL